MRILLLANLYPPHHGGTYDLRCQAVVEALRLRGHVVRVLTSNHGLRHEQRDPEIERRLLLNGVYDHPATAGFGALRTLELHNHRAVRESVAAFQPDLAHVSSLHGLSKSLFLTLHALRVPTAFDVADDWLASGLASDPWLRWWNQPGSNLVRTGLELAGERGRLDRVAPTRPHPGCDRMPGLYAQQPSAAAPDSITDFRFDRIYFSSGTLRARTQNAGFQVGHAEVITPGIAAETFAAAIKPMSAPVERFLIASDLHAGSGIMTALQALKAVRDRGRRVALGVYGRGGSDYVPLLRSYAVLHQLPVEFLPVSDLNRDVAKVYRQHDAFLHTGEVEEPYAVGLLEAMASGLPVIASWMGCVREFLRHGETGLIYAPGDAEELAARIEELQSQPALRCQMAETAQTEVLGRFNFTAMIDRVEEYLLQTLDYWRQSEGIAPDPAPE